jgi:hypothetical protein
MQVSTLIDYNAALTDEKALSKRIRKIPVLWRFFFPLRRGHKNVL